MYVVYWRCIIHKRVLFFSITVPRGSQPLSNCPSLLSVLLVSLSSPLPRYVIVLAVVFVLSIRFPILETSQQTHFLRCAVVSNHAHTPNLENWSNLFLCGSSPLTCPAWQALPVPTLPPTLRVIWPHKPRIKWRIEIYTISFWSQSNNGPFRERAGISWEKYKVKVTL